MRAWAYWCVLVVCLVLFVGTGLLVYMSAGPDDTFISLWAGEQLAAGHGFVNYNGEPLEMSSSALHACIIALIALVTPGFVYTVNKLTCLAAGVLVVIHCYRKTLFHRSPAPLLAYTFTLAALTQNPNFLYWSLGGMETPYAALILTLFVCALTRYWTTPTTTGLIVIVVSQCLYTVVRPEGFFVIPFGLIFVAFYAWFKGHNRGLWLISTVPAFFYLVVLGLRRMAFGMWFPNPVYPKASDPFGERKDGLSYLLDYFSSSYFALAQMAVLLVLTVYFAALLAKGIRRRDDAALQERLEPVFLYGMCIAGTLFVVLSGGDWMGNARFVVPYLPMLTVVTVTALFSPLKWLFLRQGKHARSLLAKGVVSLILAGLVFTSGTATGVDLVSLFGRQHLRGGGENLRPYNAFQVLSTTDGLEYRMLRLSGKHRRELDRAQPVYKEIVPELLKHRSRLTVVSGQMGLFPYMLKKRFPNADLYFIDLHGLCTREIAQMDLGRNLGGARGGNLAEIFPLNESPLSQFVAGKNPDIVFVHRMGNHEVEALRESGFIVVDNGGYRNIAYRPVE